ncbi:tRNA guanosine(34) transglycosylase Tgt [Rubrivirga sp. S365]|uniref:Queuine tRNA-ribosyltransferase n=1 Tax=Rubrivirga litoralis TaxID=3075598 RepID=A0ABU3BP80_9BACT|nr:MULTISPECIES: tRNA guanosine(34) transglycosylase Tgt [unclassified Rubrivirga]MDT0631090.1 tRNA guanosine(34) transglycosylase Tgt [Rubrivirga sp. F394]MDT7855397.1 tRNA guanosine(34) transglycosylase Tgt [Rubrivirga sp. S365]
MPLTFELQATCPDTGARAGLLHTDHGTVETPRFMPVGTVGSVKALAPRTLRELGTQILLGNTYHLALRPGRETLRALGGLHRFMAWDGPILTDSGGFQVFSLAGRRDVSEDGVTFRSHLTGDKLFFSPETVVDAQRDIGSDVMMVLDELTPATVDRAEARRANARTVRWAGRAFAHARATAPHYGHHQALFPIVQGAVYADVRRESAEALLDLDAEGYAIGGLSVGEAAPVMYDMVEVTNEVLPQSRPRYLMGVGTPQNLIENVARGVDLFDCVMPTRNARTGSLFTTAGLVNIKNARWAESAEAVDAGLDGYHSRTFSKAYLRHLTLAKEPLFMEIASAQNVGLYLWTMREMRAAILEGRFPAWRREWAGRLAEKA